MTELPSSVANWLYNVLQPQYTNKQIAYTHVYQFLQIYLNKGFKIRTSVYTSGNTGHSNLLINLFGSIEVNQNLSVPVTIWIPLNYPYNISEHTSDDIGVPMVYITPDNSRNWFIKPGNHIDTQGKFYHPYLSSWFHEYNCQPSKYNLLQLVSTLHNSFLKDVPIFYQESLSYISPVHTGLDNYKIPEKPAKIPINSPLPVPLSNNSNTELSDVSRHNTEPALSRIPLKYQSPLPLPNEKVVENSQREREIPVSAGNEIINSRQSNVLNQAQNYAVHPDNLTKQHRYQTAKETTIDLMDNDDRTVKKNLTNQTYQEALEVLSRKINEKLLETSKDNINNILPEVNTNTKKINALYQQLSHHNQQACANSENLDNHISYLSNQLSSLTSLNNELIQLDGLNSQQKNMVSTNNKSKFELDNLVIPDLALVNQLYNIVSEIKATKDTICLIGGNFQSESEIINDSRMDACVKAVRGLGRELFWLEVMKREIAVNSMGLSS